MKSILFGAFCASLVNFTLVTSANAALIAGSNGVYDTDLDITWLLDANAGAGSPFDNGFSTTDGIMSWTNARDWADSLAVGAATNWRLPDTDPACGTAFNCISSEMGHLYYTELGNAAGGPLTNTGPFLNVQSIFYWSGTEFASDPRSAWVFRFDDGFQFAFNKDGNYLAWAVHSGDVSAIPLPAAGWLFGSGLIGLLGWRSGWRRKA